MNKITRYHANGCRKTCWGCGNLFVIRDGRSEAIVGLDDRLYCYGTACGDDELASKLVPLHSGRRETTFTPLRASA